MQQKGVHQSSADAPGTPYLRTLLLLLVSATFFEGFDASILALILPQIRDTFAVSESVLGVSRGLIEGGLGAAFFLARAADSIGRRRLLVISVIGYTIMTAATAFAWDIWSFTAFQFVARIFIGAEYAVAVTMIVEEFPAQSRAKALGKLLLGAAAGAVVVGLLLVAGVDQGRYEWRVLYLIGLIPLLGIAFLRRKVRETRRFEELGDDNRRGFFEPWRAEYRRNLVFVGIVHLLRSLPLFAGTSWFFYFGIREQGVAPRVLYATFIGAYGLGILGYWLCGWAMEHFGRRRTAVVWATAAAISTSALFRASDPVWLAALLLIAVFFGLGMAPALGAMSTELFPTAIRNAAAAWARNIFEISGFILGPLLVGVLGDHYTGVFGSVGDTVSLLAILFVPCALLMWRYLPETKGLELEQIMIEPDRSKPAVSNRGIVSVVSASLVLGIVTVMGLFWVGDLVRRPEGAAERFLQAASRGEAEHILEFGSVELATRLGVRDADAIEVGDATGTAVVTVPFKVTMESGEVTGELFVDGGRDVGYRVVEAQVTDVTGKIPSEGGPPPNPMPGWAWLVALGFGAVVALVCDRLIWWSGRGVVSREVIES